MVDILIPLDELQVDKEFEDITLGGVQPLVERKGDSSFKVKEGPKFEIIIPKLHRSTSQIEVSSSSNRRPQPSNPENQVSSSSNRRPQPSNPEALPSSPKALPPNNQLSNLDEDEQVSDNNEDEQSSDNNEDEQSSDNNEDEQSSEAGKLILKLANFKCQCEWTAPASQQSLSLLDFAHRRDRVEYIHTVIQPAQTRRIPKPLSYSGLLPVEYQQQKFPWQDILCGGEEPSCLDFTLSESEVVNPNPSRRTWDVDSFFASPRSLGFFKRGFKLLCMPSFFQSINQDAFVSFAGHKQIHRMKHMQFGQGFMSNHLNCHIFFPHLQIKDKGEAYLTHREQEVWFDQVVIPSLKEVADTDILQHWPRSWSEAYHKSRVHEELQLEGQHSHIRYDATIPPKSVQRFWQILCNRISRARRDSGIEVFRNPFLLVSGHNLKVQYRSCKRTSVQQEFLEDLEFLFDMEELVEEDCWIDLGIEVTPPILGSNEVYLLKSGCLDEWQRQFREYDDTNGVQGQEFNWFLTRDAASGRVIMSNKHQLRQQGLAYVKYYNLHKDIFAAPLKRSRPYCYQHLEGLAVSEATVKGWYETRKAGLSRPIHAALLRILATTKTRLDDAINKTKLTEFGVRQEFRISISLFREMSEMEGDEEDEEDEDDTCHPTHWRLPTDHVEKFIRSELNRWLLPLEHLVVQSTAVGAEPIDLGQEYRRSASIVAILRVLRVGIFEGFSKGSNSLWRERFTYNKRGRGEDEDEEVRRYGLGIHDSLERYGSVWVRKRLFDGESLFFTPKILGNIVFNHNYLQNQMNRQKRPIQRERDAVEQELLLKRLQAMLEEQEQGSGIDIWSVRQFGVFTQLICQSLIMQLFRDNEDIFTEMKDVPESTRRGVEGLNLEVLWWTTGCIPHLSVPRKAARGNSSYEKSFGLNWVDKVSGLFDFRQYNPGWATHAKFRQKTKDCHGLIQQVLGKVVADSWLDQIGSLASPYLLMIPAYDEGKLVTPYKASKNHAETTRRVINTMSRAERSNFYCAQWRGIGRERMRVEYNQESGELEEKGEVRNGERRKREREWAREAKEELEFYGIVGYPPIIGVTLRGHRLGEVERLEREIEDKMGEEIEVGEESESEEGEEGNEE